MYRFSITLLISLAFFVACRKDFDTTTDTVLGPIPTKNVQATLTGRVVDQSGSPVSGATVQLAGLMLTTDEAGFFFVHNKLMDRNGTHVQVRHEGYYNAHRFAFPELNNSAYLEISILQKGAPQSFDAAAGAVLIIFGCEIQIPANAIADAAGQLYTGQVNAYVIRFDPSFSRTFDWMPGDLRGRDAEGYAKILKTFGMFGVELESPSGEKLNLLPGRKATVSLSVPAALSADAPATIPTWHFNETNGYWEEEGSATLSNNIYTFEVEHFSFWNCDVPADMVYLTGSLKDTNGNPLVSTKVTVSQLTFGNGYEWTDNQGRFAGWVPKDEALKINVLDNCDQLAYDENIGPFSSDTDLGAITIDSDYRLRITGVLRDCNMNPLVDGLVLIQKGDTVIAVVQSDGAGHFTANMLDCAEQLGISLRAFDQENYLQAGPLTVLPVDGFADVGTIHVCDALDEYITLNLDGTTKTFPYNLWFSSMAGKGSLYGSGSLEIDTVGVYLQFDNYQNLQANVTQLYITLRAQDQSLLDYGCQVCQGCSCTGTTIQFTEFPATVGQYAVGSMEGFVVKFPDLAPIPYSINFRIKRQ